MAVNDVHGHELGDRWLGGDDIVVVFAGPERSRAFLPLIARPLARVASLGLAALCGCALRPASACRSPRDAGSESDHLMRHKGRAIYRERPRQKPPLRVRQVPGTCLETLEAGKEGVRLRTAARCTAWVRAAESDETYGLFVRRQAQQLPESGRLHAGAAGQSAGEQACLRRDQHVLDGAAERNQLFIPRRGAGIGVVHHHRHHQARRVVSLGECRGARLFTAPRFALRERIGEHGAQIGAPLARNQDEAPGMQSTMIGGLRGRFQNGAQIGWIGTGGGQLAQRYMAARRQMVEKIGVHGGKVQVGMRTG